MQAAFKVLCGTTYDSSDERHVLYGTEGVLIRLLVMTAQSPVDDWNSWKKSMKEELALVTGRDRMAASTNSPLTPTVEQSGSLPAADSSVFTRRFIPNSPAGGASGDRFLGDS